MARKTYGLGKQLATLALGATLLAACGSTSAALSSTPDGNQHAAVIRDPGNPAWIGSSEQVTKAIGGQSVIRDPENSYWGLSSRETAPYDTAIDPVRGPK